MAATSFFIRMHREREEVLGIFEKYLTLWVIACAIIGLFLGNYFPSLIESASSWTIPGTMLPTIIGFCLFFMIYPILVNTSFEKLGGAIKTPKASSLTVLFAWGVKPFLMFGLAWFFLSFLWNLPEYAMGIIILGCAPCTAMVLFWAMISKSSREFTVVISAVHTLIMLAAYAPLTSYLAGLIIPVPWKMIALSVGVFLGLPLVLGLATRRSVLKRKGRNWFEEKFSPLLDNIAHVGLFITLIVLFSLKGEVVINNPLLTFKIATPLLIEFYLLFLIGFFVAKHVGVPYKHTAVVGFDGSSNHFEIAIAAAAATWGIASPQAFATVVGPLFEVPVMLSIAGLCLKFRGKFFRLN